MPNLVVIKGLMAYRYVNGKLDQKAEIDFNQPIRFVKEHIEHFRVHGLDFSEE